MSMFHIRNIPGTSRSKTGVWYKSTIGYKGDPLAAAICVNKVINRVDIAISDLDLNLLFNAVFKQLSFMFNELKICDEEQMGFEYFAEAPDDMKWTFKRVIPLTPVENKQNFLLNFDICNYKRFIVGIRGDWLDPEYLSGNETVEARIGIDALNKKLYIAANVFDDLMILYRAYKEIQNGFTKIGIPDDVRNEFHIYEDNIRSATGTRMKAIETK